MMAYALEALLHMMDSVRVPQEGIPFWAFLCPPALCRVLPHVSGKHSTHAAAQLPGVLAVLFGCSADAMMHVQGIFDGAINSRLKATAPTTSDEVRKVQAAACLPSSSAHWAKFLYTVLPIGPRRSSF